MLSDGDGAAQAALFEDRQNEFFGGAWIGSGFEDDQLTFLQVRLDGDGGLLDVAQIGLAAFIQRSGNADDDAVALAQLFEIGGGAEMLAVDELLNFDLQRCARYRTSRH